VIAHEAEVMREYLDPRISLRWARCLDALAAWAATFPATPQARAELDRELSAWLEGSLKHLLRDLALVYVYSSQGSLPGGAGNPRLEDLGPADYEGLRARVKELAAEFQHRLDTLPLLRDPPGPGAHLLRLHLLAQQPGSEDLEHLREARRLAQAATSEDATLAARFWRGGLLNLPSAFLGDSLPCDARLEYWLGALAFLEGPGGAAAPWARGELAAELLFHWYTVHAECVDDPALRSAAFSRVMDQAERDGPEAPSVLAMMVEFFLREDTASSMLRPARLVFQADAERLQALRERALRASRVEP